MRRLLQPTASIANAFGIAVILSGMLQSSEVNSQDAAYRPVVGKPHSQVTLPRIGNRKAVSLSDFRGKKVLLIHFASW